MTNATPVVAITKPITRQALPAGTVTIQASFTDLGVLDTHQCQISWRTGETAPISRGTVNEHSGAGSCTGTRPLRPGTYTVQVTITDDDGGTGRATATFLVHDRN